MKRILAFGFVGILIFSCSKKQETSSVPDLSDLKGQPSAQPAEAKSSPKNEGDKTLSGYALINASDCLSCHKSDEKLIGPSYAEIAKKYIDNKAYKEILAEKIINGGSGVWGNVPMAPHPQISKEDAQKMAEYILTFK